MSRLATGGMAEIWLATQNGSSDFRRCVVIKKILPHLTREQGLVTMFLDEARTSALLNHRNIVQIYDLGRDGETYFIAMEYIAGENIGAMRLRAAERQRPMTYGMIARIVADVAQALHHAHSRINVDGAPLGLVHRDISPQNILVTYDGVVKVVDFGIAKARTHVLKTVAGMLKGKHGYMSPEQALGEQIDFRSDIFSLGIVLYELCTGRMLFKAKSEFRTLDMIARADIAPPSRYNQAIPPELERIAMRALSRHPADRFESSEAMGRELEAFMQLSEHRGTSTELAQYMQSLFAEDIEEKQELYQAALRGEPATPPRRRSSWKQGQRYLTALSAVFRSASPRARSLTIAPLGPFSFKEALSVAGRTSFAPPVVAEPNAFFVERPRPVSELLETVSWPARIGTVLALLAVVVGVALGLRALSRLQAGQEGPRVNLAVRSVPEGATIYLNGRPILLPGETARFASTPFELVNVAADELKTVRFVLAGYESSEVPVKIGSGGPEPVVVTLKPVPPNVRIRVQGRGTGEAEILFDGALAARGPTHEARVPPGRLDVEVRPRRGVCTPASRQLDVEPKGVYDLEFVCEPRDPRDPREPAAKPSTKKSRPSKSGRPTNVRRAFRNPQLRGGR